MKQYTKGEWTINHKKGIRIEATGKCICLLGDIEEEDEANSLLISAAPRLLEWIKAKADNGDNDAQCFLATLDLLH